MSGLRPALSKAESLVSLQTDRPDIIIKLMSTSSVFNMYGKYILS